MHKLTLESLIEFEPILSFSHEELTVLHDKGTMYIQHC